MLCALLYVAEGFENQSIRSYYSTVEYIEDIVYSLVYTYKLVIYILYLTRFSKDLLQQFLHSCSSADTATSTSYCD